MQRRLKRPISGRFTQIGAASALAAALIFSSATVVAADEGVVDQTTPSEVAVGENPVDEPIIDTTVDDPTATTPDQAVGQVSSAPVGDPVGGPVIEPESPPQEPVASSPADMAASSPQAQEAQIQTEASIVAPTMNTASTGDEEYVPELSVTNVTPEQGTVISGPVTVSFDYAINAPASTWVDPGEASLWVTVTGVEAQMVRLNLTEATANGTFQQVFSLPSGIYTLQIEGFLAVDCADCAPFYTHYTGTFSVQDEPGHVEPIYVERPEQNGEIVTIPDIPGVEFFEVGTGTTLATGTHSAFPELVVNARPTGERPVISVDGPWTYTWTEPMPEPAPEPAPETGGPVAPGTPPQTGTGQVDTIGQGDGDGSAVTEQTRVLATTGDSMAVETSIIAVTVAVALIALGSVLTLLRRFRRKHV